MKQQINSSENPQENSTSDKWDDRWYDKFAERLNKEGELDRVIAIILATDLEEDLHIILSSFLVDSKASKELFAYTSLFGTFDAKIKAAYCLGLISEDEFHNLNVIRKVRNRFAHSSSSLSFEDKKIRKYCNKLRQPNYEPPGLRPHDAFMSAQKLLSEKLTKRAIKAVPERRTIPPEIPVRPPRPPKATDQ